MHLKPQDLKSQIYHQARGILVWSQADISMPMLQCWLWLCWSEWGNKEAWHEHQMKLSNICWSQNRKICYNFLTNGIISKQCFTDINACTTDTNNAQHDLLHGCISTGKHSKTAFQIFSSVVCLIEILTRYYGPEKIHRYMNGNKSCGVLFEPALYKCQYYLKVSRWPTEPTDTGQQSVLISGLLNYASFLYNEYQIHIAMNLTWLFNIKYVWRQQLHTCVYS